MRGPGALTRRRPGANFFAMRTVTRRPLLMLPFLAPLTLAGCSWRKASGSSREMAPLRYDHLTPLKLNVAVVDTEVQYSPGPGDLGSRAPTPPVAALRQMAQDRMGAFGGSGRAVFSIRQASVTRIRGGYEGALGVRLDIQGNDGAALGYAEARVARRNVVDEEERWALYEIVRQMMDSMNVEFEFQVRKALRNFLVAGDAAAPAPTTGPVERQELTPPPSKGPLKQ